MSPQYVQRAPQAGQAQWRTGGRPLHGRQPTRQAFSSTASVWQARCEQYGQTRSASMHYLLVQV